MVVAALQASLRVAASRHDALRPAARRDRLAVAAPVPLAVAVGLRRGLAPPPVCSFSLPLRLSRLHRGHAIDFIYAAPCHS